MDGPGGPILGGNNYRMTVEVSVYVRECGQDLLLFAIWNKCVHMRVGVCMRVGVVYTYCGWS